MTNRSSILDTALAQIRAGETVSLESAARAAGLTKPGLMYHFPTKQALMLALVDHVVEGYARELGQRLPVGVALAEATVEQRLAAYVDWSCTAEVDQADLVIFMDPRLRVELAERWTEHLDRWVGVPDDVPAERRARLLAARLVADGSWFADASGCLPLAGRDRQGVLDVALGLLEATP